MEKEKDIFSVEKQDDWNHNCDLIYPSEFVDEIEWQIEEFWSVVKSVLELLNESWVVIKPENQHTLPSINIEFPEDWKYFK
jgi:hypothetical protein